MHYPEATKITKEDMLRYNERRAEGKAELLRLGLIKPKAVEVNLDEKAK